ncbi:MAG: hypothetical protein U1F56_12260 [Rubrivivax sp.]
MLAALLLAMSAQATPSQCDAVAGNLVHNCGFESDTLVWTRGGQLVNMNADGVRVQSGGGAWTFANRDRFGRPDIYPDQGPGYLSQTLATRPGALYELSFWLLNNGVDDPVQFPAPFSYNGFSVDWDGATVFEQVDVNVPRGTNRYQHYTLQLTASAGSTALRMGGFHNMAANVLDDVVVVELAPPPGTPVPAPGSLTLAALSAGLLGAATRRRPSATPGGDEVQARPRRRTSAAAEVRFSTPSFS